MCVNSAAPLRMWRKETADTVCPLETVAGFTEVLGRLRSSCILSLRWPFCPYCLTGSCRLSRSHTGNSSRGQRDPAFPQTRWSSCCSRLNYLRSVEISAVLENEASISKVWSWPPTAHTRPNEASLISLTLSFVTCQVGTIICPKYFPNVSMKNPCESHLKEKCVQRTPLFGGHIVVYVICRLHIHIGTIIVRAGVEGWMSGANVA